MSEDDFYQSDDWIRLRYQALKRAGGICQCCGDTPSKGNPLQVDHINPRSRYPSLALDITNLQVLCKKCNIAKGAGDRTDWRAARKPYIPHYNKKWTAYKKAMACCEFIRDKGLGLDAKWYVQNVMLPLLGMTKPEDDYISWDQAGECFRDAISGAAFFNTNNWHKTDYPYCNEQWALHLANIENVNKTMGSLIWICREAGMRLPWINEIRWEQDFERVAKELATKVTWTKDPVREVTPTLEPVRSVKLSKDLF